MGLIAKRPVTPRAAWRRRAARFGGEGEHLNSLEKKYYPYSFIFPALFFFLAFFIAPMVLGFGISLTNWNMQRASRSFVGMRNYLTIFEDPSFATSLKNTLLFSFMTTLGKLGIGLGLALLLNIPFKTRTYLRTIFYVPGVLSYVVVGILFSVLFQADGVVNHVLLALGAPKGVDWLGDASLAIWTCIFMDIWMFTGLHMIIYIAGLQGIPQEYYDAAEVDGSGAWMRFRHISYPLLLPARRINLVLSLVGGFKVFEQVKVLTNGGPGRASYTMNLLVLKFFGQGYYGKATAVEFVLSASIFLFTLLLYAYFNKKAVD